MEIKDSLTDFWPTQYVLGDLVEIVEGPTVELQGNRRIGRWCFCLLRLEGKADQQWETLLSP
jgi:hypothetical protein